jgi:hypothetical protein
MTLTRSGALRLALAALVVTGAAGCSDTQHPLDGDGTVEIVADVDGPLFAKRNEAGLQGRQAPYEMNVSLWMTRGGKPEHGAYVDVRVTPPPALSLHETDGTCVPVEGAFRCTGNGEGYAHFLVRSDSAWSGTARLNVQWSNNSTGIDVKVKPAGLPEGTTNFELLAEGTDGTEAARLRAVYPFADICTLGGAPTQRWPSDNYTIRNATLHVHAAAPIDMPTVLESAPVILSSDSSEAEFSRSKDCLTRETSLIVQLDAKGDSPPVYACFSNVGGSIKLSAASGEVLIGPSRSFVVDPEPRLIEIKSLVPMGTVGTEAFFWQVVAYGAATMLPVAIQVEYQNTSDVPMVFRQTSALTSADLSAPTTVNVTPTQAGAAKIRVYPQFRPDLSCESPEIPVVEPPTGGAQ